MGQYDSKQVYPKAFYDTGGGSANLINPNKIQSGNLLGAVNLDGGSITGGTTVLSSGGLSVGGTPIVINSSGALSTGAKGLSLLGPFNVAASPTQFLADPLYNNDGITLFTPAVGDLILSMWCYTEILWSGGDGTGGVLFTGINMGAGDGSITALSNLCMFSLGPASTTVKTGINSLVQPYYEGPSGLIRVNPSNVATALSAGPMRIISSTKPVCVRAAGNTAASHLTAGNSDIYALVFTTV